MYEKIGELNDDMARLIMYKMDEGMITIEMNVGSYCAMRMKIPQKEALEFAFGIMGECNEQ